MWSIIERFWQPELSATIGGNVASAVFAAMLFSLGVAAIGWVIGVAVGLLLAILMQRFSTAESGLLPYVVLARPCRWWRWRRSSSGGVASSRFFGRPWQPWMSVAVIAAYLAFFPVAIGALRGLQSPAATQVELMRAYAGTWWQHPGATAAAGQRPAPAAGAAAGRCGLGRRRDRRRDLDRDQGRDRPAHHRLRPGRHRRSAEAVHRHPRRGRARPRRRRARGLPRGGTSRYRRWRRPDERGGNDSGREPDDECGRRHRGEQDLRRQQGSLGGGAAGRRPRRRAW